jgi:hypothetical protein
MVIKRLPLAAGANHFCGRDPSQVDNGPIPKDYFVVRIEHKERHGGVFQQRTGKLVLLILIRHHLFERIGRLAYRIRSCHWWIPILSRQCWQSANMLGVLAQRINLSAATHQHYKYLLRSFFALILLGYCIVIFILVLNDWPL